MQELCDKMVEADALIFGSPVYWLSVTAQAKAVIDRTYSLYMGGRKLRDKVGGVVVEGEPSAQRSNQKTPTGGHRREGYKKVQET